jgi:preprotein translocase SecE subunit
MADKDKIAKRSDKANEVRKGKKVGFVEFFVRLSKRFKNFVISLKAELKRVIWPDRKKLIQSTSTVLAICLLAAVILFVVDQALVGILNGVGFYTPAATTVSTTAAASETTAATTTAAVTTAATTTAATTTAATTTAATTTAG